MRSPANGQIEFVLPREIHGRHDVPGVRALTEPFSAAVLDGLITTWSRPVCLAEDAKKPLVG
ncbi:hypothetical protein ACFY4C_40375, partial [Actinomadura viridis]|uniref:hypothetical protein n=1 Tax=Actinomadura viridis TaxID=58110 RepID=UPI003681DAB8